MVTSVQRFGQVDLLEAAAWGGDVPKLGYDSGASVVLDADALQAAVDEAMKNAKVFILVIVRAQQD